MRGEMSRNHVQPISSQEADKRFWAKVVKTDTCWLWQGVMSDGKPGHFVHHKRYIQVRRKAYETLNGPVPPKHRLWSRCGVPRCIRPAPGHLEALRQGTRTPIPHGAAHHRAAGMRLTWQEVLILNGLACAGLPNWRLRAIFAVSESTVNEIVTKRHRWLWLTRYLPRAQRTHGRRHADGSPPTRKPEIIPPSAPPSPEITPIAPELRPDELTPEKPGLIFGAWQSRGRTVKDERR